MKKRKNVNIFDLNNITEKVCATCLYYNPKYNDYFIGKCSLSNDKDNICDSALWCDKWKLGSLLSGNAILIEYKRLLKLKMKFINKSLNEIMKIVDQERDNKYNVG